MPASKAGITTLVIVIILAIIGGAVIAYKGNTQQATPQAGTPEKGEASPLTTPSQKGESESYNAPVEVVKQMNINIGNAPNIIRISKFALTIYAGTGNVTVDMMLPNPCYNATLRYESSNSTIILLVKSPSPGTMCVQVLKPLSLSTSITPPPSGEVTFMVVVDGKVAAQVPINLPS
ncbi:MAG: hypothetical protein F7C33_01195 [Desulfurococcales archaeon]|nr:hypothetical protein [Desulfurococcales archaeon]